MIEQGLCFDCEGETLVGVLARPRPESSDVGVVIVVGGPQYRAGSHRLFVQLSRVIASYGYPVLRFDVRGMGDSSGERMPHFESIGPDIEAAIGALQRNCPSVRRVVLWGLCDGASAILMYADDSRDERLAGFCLVNPWVRSAESQARTQVKHYYKDRLMQREFWLKLLRGQVAGEAWRGFVRNLRAAKAGAHKPVNTSFQQRMLRGWSRASVPSLLLMSGADYTAREFDEYAAASADWQLALARSCVTRVDLPNADHTLSERQHRERAEKVTVAWLLDHVARVGVASPDGGRIPSETHAA